MAKNSVYSVLISSFCSVMLVSAATAGSPLLRGFNDRMNLDIQAKMAGNAGFTGGAKIPVTPAPAIENGAEVEVNTPEKKAQLDELASILVFKKLKAKASLFNQFARLMEIQEDPETGMVNALLFTGHWVFARRLDGQEKFDFIIYQFSPNKTGIAMLTSSDGVLKKAFSLSTSSPVEMTLEEAADVFQAEKTFWLAWVDRVNRAALSKAKKK